MRWYHRRPARDRAIDTRAHRAGARLRRAVDPRVDAGRAALSRLGRVGAQPRSRRVPRDPRLHVPAVVLPAAPRLRAHRRRAVGGWPRRGALGTWANVGGLVACAYFVFRDISFGLTPGPSGLIPFDRSGSVGLRGARPAGARVDARLVVHRVGAVRVPVVAAGVDARRVEPRAAARRLPRAPRRVLVGDGYRHPFTLFGKTATVRGRQPRVHLLHRRADPARHRRDRDGQTSCGRCPICCRRRCCSS